MSSADDLRAFGRLVKERRQAARLSIERLAKLCAVSSTTIKHVEKGRASLSTCSALLTAPELRLAVDDLPPFAREPHRRHGNDTALLRLGLSLTDFAAREQILDSVRRFASHRDLSELGEWAEAKLRALHRLRAALYASDELPPALRTCVPDGPTCVGTAERAQCGGK
jgi:transcriptional regulator with XRE-family HTH domain